jgi:serine/threonine-protein kinase
MMLAEGKILGHCRIESLIGEGSSARVYKAVHQTLGIPVAVKALKPAPHDSLASHLATYRDRFRREAQLAARINHDGIVRVLDFGEDAGQLFLVMEYVNGHTLAEYLRKGGPISEEMALKVVAWLATALHAAHSRNIVHRDVKPGNILITRDGWLKISDLGLAKEMDARDFTNVDTLLGTPYYMAPECFKPGLDQGPEVDLYSLGVILYEMLTGRPPFTGTLTQVISGHLHAEPVYPSPANGARIALPDATVAILKTLLAKDPMARPRNGREVAELCQARLQNVRNGGAFAVPAAARDTRRLAESGTFQRLGQFMERNLGSSVSEYQGRRVLHTTGRERVLIWILAGLFLSGAVAAYLASR